MPSKIRAAGICHSDLAMVDGTLAPAYPLVLGHEATGVVAEAGPGATLAAVLRSSVYGSTDPDREVPELAAALAAGDLDLAPLVSGTVSLSEAPAALDRLAEAIGLVTGGIFVLVVLLFRPGVGGTVTWPSAGRRPAGTGSADPAYAGGTATRVARRYPPA
nr:alcohol dehydrogenase catalytic domain-containing protein [Micromonospora sp. CNB394]